MIRNGKIFLNSNISSTCAHNMVDFGRITVEIGWRVSGTPANFNGFRHFRVLPSLLQRRRSTEVNQTLHDVWSSSGLVHYLCKIHFASNSPSLAFSCTGSVTQAVGVSQTLRRGTRNGITELSLLVICHSHT